MKKYYALLLRLFPKPYREEYADELEAVFNLAFEEALETGRIEPARLMVRELFSLPKAIVYVYLREMRRTMTGRQFSSGFEFTRGSQLESFVALIPLFFLFTLTGGISLLFSFIDGFPVWLAEGLALLLIGLFVILLLVGLVKGLPRWSIPYLGLLVALLSIYGFSEFLYAYFGFYDFYGRSWVLGGLINQAYMWSGLVLILLFLVMTSAILLPFRLFRQDWTLLSFMAYGAAPLAVLIAFDDYLQDEPYTLLALFVLAVGIWFYLHTTRKWRRFLILFTCLTLSMWMAGVSKTILGPSQPWFRGNGIDWRGPEMMSPIITWIWLTGSMLLPSVIHLFPKFRRTVPAD